MYRTSPSLRRHATPLQGLASGLGLSGLKSFYQLPQYTCVFANTVPTATQFCTPEYEAAKKDVTWRYMSTPHPSKKGPHFNSPYKITGQDASDMVFNPCDIKKRSRACDVPQIVVPSPPQTAPKPPVVVPSPPQTAPKPPVVVPSPPQSSPETTAKPVSTPATYTPATYTPSAAPAPPAPPPQQADTPVSFMEEPVFVETFAEEEGPEEAPTPEEAEDKSQLYLVGGLLALVAGGGLAYYLATKKKKRR